MIYSISSKDNKVLKMARQLDRKTARVKEKMFVAEGKRIVLEALEYAPNEIFCIIIAQSFCDKNSDVLSRCEKICNNIYIVKDHLFDGLSATETPQGIMAIMRIREKEFEATEKNRKIVVLDGVSEPGNMGTIIRTAEALGYDGIYLTKGCADIFSPKTIRSTMGSVFRMKFRTNCDKEDLLDLKRKGFSLISTTPLGDVSLEGFKAHPKFAVIIGNEAHGISQEAIDLSDFKVKITMDGMAESLNAAVAAGIAMHWLNNC